MAMNIKISTLATIVSFKKGSSLKTYMDEKTRIIKRFYMIGEILAILKAVISEEKMYDVRNPSIVLCSPELELVLDRKALHISELTGRIMNQVAWAPDYSLECSKGSLPLNEPSRRND